MATVEDVDKEPIYLTTQTSNVNSSQVSPRNEFEISDRTERGNTIVKFFKYKDIKNKYKKSKTQNVSLPVQSSKKEDDDHLMSLKYKLDNTVIKDLKDAERNIMIYGLFNPKQ